MLPGFPPRSAYVAPSSRRSKIAQRSKSGLTCCSIRPFVPLPGFTKNLTPDIFHGRDGGFLHFLQHHSTENRGNSGNKHKESRNGAGYRLVINGNNVGTTWEQSGNKQTIFCIVRYEREKSLFLMYFLPFPCSLFPACLPTCPPLARPCWRCASFARARTLLEMGA